MADLAANMMPMMMLFTRQDLPIFIHIAMIVATLISMKIWTHFQTFYKKTIEFVKSKPTICYKITENICIKDGQLNQSLYKYNQYDIIMSKILEKLKMDKNYVIETIKLPNYGSNIEFVKIVDDLYITPEIYVTTNMYNQVNVSNGYNISTWTLEILLHSNVLSCQEIIQFINDSIKNKRKNDEDEAAVNKIRHIRTIGKNKNSLYPDKSIIGSNKTFTSLFFEQKDMIIRRLDRFMNNKAEYDKLGIPHTLGIMLYGSPGTGKTSCIKAISNYMKRDLVHVPTKYIYSSDNLNQLFTLYGNVNQVIYVFEEIDCGLWRDIVWSRELKPEDDMPQHMHEYVSETKSSVLDILQAEKKDEKIKDEPAELKLTLAELLERLDGIYEDPGRVIIFTTNRPHIIDSALLRPGRIDISIEMKKMRRIDIADMYRLWFDCELPYKVMNQIKDYQFSQAELGQLFMTYAGDELFAKLCV